MAIVLAFSGGLDTSYCVPFLRERYDDDVHTVTVNTGGLDAEAADALSGRSAALGASSHETIDARQGYFDHVLRYLIQGNVTREGYPLCVGPERVVQAKEIASFARRIGARAVAHGSTGAGNDQVRFDVALRVLAPEVEVFAPIRTFGVTRDEARAYLIERGLPCPSHDHAYSVNAGLWGTTVGGRETKDAKRALPDTAFPSGVGCDNAPDHALDITITFTRGIPTALDQRALDPVDLIEALNDLGSQYGVGRGMHIGDTVMGIKGRIGFDAPAATILLEAHRNLEKVVLTQLQRRTKALLADEYGRLLHEAQYFDPVMRDIEAFIDNSQADVNGDVGVSLFKGSARIMWIDSPNSLFASDVATYGEVNSLWDGRDAEGFSKITSIPSVVANRSSAEPARRTES